MTSAGRSCFNIFLFLKPAEGDDGHINDLDADERNNDAAEAVDQKIARQQCACADRLISNALQRKRDQRDNDECVEDDRREDRALWGCKPHDVERAKLRIKGEKHRGNDCKVLGNVIGNRESCECAARHQQLLADLNNLDELGWIAIEIDHIPGLACGNRTRIHGNADIGLRGLARHWCRRRTSPQACPWPVPAG